jgi:hypothetical protein
LEKKIIATCVGYVTIKYRSKKCCSAAFSGIGTVNSFYDETWIGEGQNLSIGYKYDGMGLYTQPDFWFHKQLALTRKIGMLPWGFREPAIFF